MADSKVIVTSTIQYKDKKGNTRTVLPADEPQAIPADVAKECVERGLAKKPAVAKKEPARKKAVAAKPTDDSSAEGGEDAGDKDAGGEDDSGSSGDGAAGEGSAQ